MIWVQKSDCMYDLKYANMHQIEFISFLILESKNIFW